MPKVLKLATMGLLVLLISCQRKANVSQEATVPADTVTSVQSEFQQDQEKMHLLDLSYSQRKGKLLYEKYCAVCHGLEGKGDGFNAYNLDPKPKDFSEAGYLESVTDVWLLEAISQGGRGVKRSVLMPSYENTLIKGQIEDIVAYLRFLSKK